MPHETPTTDAVHAAMSQAKQLLTFHNFDLYRISWQNPCFQFLGRHQDTNSKLHVYGQQLLFSLWQSPLLIFTPSLLC